MFQKFSHGFRILQSALQRRTFLLRLFATTMLVAFLPTSIACMNLVTSESQRAYENSVAQLESTAATAMVQFENMISSLNSINMRLMTASELYENVIGQSVQTETDALKLIDSFHIMLPFVRGYALYLPERGIAYSNDGKLQKNGLARFVAGITEAELDAIIAQSDATGSFAARSRQQWQHALRGPHAPGQRHPGIPLWRIHHFFLAISKLYALRADERLPDLFHSR